MTFTAGAVLTAAQLNLHLRDNLLASEAALIQQSHDYIISTGYNQLARRQVAHQFVATSEKTTSTDYTDLGTSADPSTTTGPSVTVETTNRAWVILTAHMQCDNDLSSIYMSYAITRPQGDEEGDGVQEGTVASGENATGGGEREAGDNWALCHDGLSLAGSFRRSYIDFISSDLAPGLNTFTCKYRVGSSNVKGTFTNRSIIVIPM
jgi:hypothetical protein